MAQGKPFERSQHQGNPSKNGDLIAHFWKSPHPDGATVLMTLCTSRSTKRKGALSRDLRECYGVAIQLPAVDGERVQCFIFQTESEFDDEVLAALSGVGCGGQPRVQ